MEFHKSFIIIFLTLFLHTVASNSTYENFITCFSNKTGKLDIIYTPSNTPFTSVFNFYVRNRRYNRTTSPKPSVIMTPTDQTHVQAAVLCAKSATLQLRIRSGGHDYEGQSYVSETTYIVLDMSNLRSITIDSVTQTAWVQAGTTLARLFPTISSFSKQLGFPAGVCPTVGIGGHFSGGGYGNMLRKYGLSVDHVIDAVIVDVNGRVLDRKAMGEDLFWAIRGGGGASFGVILAYKIELVPVPPIVTIFRVEKRLDNKENMTDIVHRWQSAATSIDDDLFIRMVLQPITSKIKKRTKTIRATFISLFLGDAYRLIDVMDKGFPELGLKKEVCKEMNWIESVIWRAGFPNESKAEALLVRSRGTINFSKRKSDYVQTPILQEELEAIWEKMVQLGKVGFVFNPYGGRMSEISETETPFPHRAGNLFKIQYSVNWKEEDIDFEKNYTSQASSLYDFMTPYVSKNPRGAYLNYRDLDIGITSSIGKESYSEGKVYGTKYYKGNFDRLVKVKTKVDPDNFFKYEQSIPTLTVGCNPFHCNSDRSDPVVIGGSVAARFICLNKVAIYGVILLSSLFEH